MKTNQIEFKKKNGGRNDDDDRKKKCVSQKGTFSVGMLLILWQC